VRALAAFAAALLVAAAAVAQTPAPTRSAVPKPKGTPKKGGVVPKPNFSGDWVLDPQASKGVSKAMKGAELHVRQTGDHIWVEPIGGVKGRLLSEEIVADGRSYEKVLGARQKGTVQAAWGKDGELWIEAAVGDPENSNGGRQRMIWRLRDGGQTWTRQTRTLQSDGTARDTFLVFRKRAPGAVPSPSPSPSAPTAPRGNR
jgi:hypothetical protein